MAKRLSRRSSRVAPTMSNGGGVSMNAKADQVVIDLNDSEKISANPVDSKTLSLFLFNRIFLLT